MPVPSNSHLQWIDVRDFSPGLWEKGDWLIPAGGAQTMTDCYPQEGGGLRAFYKPTTIPATGIGANERLIGFFGYGAGHRTLPTTGTDYYCVTYSSSDFRPRIYRWDQTDATELQWRVITTLAVATASNNAPNEVFFTAYVLSSGTVRILASINYVGTDTGIWAATQATVATSQTFAKIAGTAGGLIAIHQSRIVEARNSTIYFTGPGNETFATDFVTIEPQRNLGNVKAIMAMAPGDLLVVTEGAGWFAVQGDLTSPTVRAMSSAHSLGNPNQQLVDTGYGLAFIEDAGGIYLSNSGVSFDKLDAQLNTPTQPGGGVVSVGDLVFHQDMLFCPRGYVFDFHTKAWFRQSLMTTGLLQFAVRNLALFTTLAGTTTIYRLATQDGSSRSNSMTWKSPVLRHGSGRQIEIREVQVVAKSYTGTSSIAVTVNGVTRTLGSLGVGTHHLAFLFRERGETLDVQVVSASGDSGTEAPSIETVKIGHRGGHLLA